MQQRELLNSEQLNLTLHRLCYQLIENHSNFANTALIGLQPRGVVLARRIKKQLESILGNNVSILYGELDITFFRDDFRQQDKTIVPSKTTIDFSIENKNVVLIDDVLFTGRTIRSGLDAMLAFGRPAKVELLVLVDRRFQRDLPIQPNYIGCVVDTIQEEKVKVLWKETEEEDKVFIINK